jgi:hypothetical protein
MRFGIAQEPVKSITQIWGSYAADPNPESGINQTEKRAAVRHRQRQHVEVICIK